MEGIPQLYWVFPVFLRNQFETLIRTIHVVDVLSVDVKIKEDKKLWKVRPWVDNLQQNFLKVFSEEFNSVEEIMVLLKGRCYLRQHLPNKPHKWGFKICGRSAVSGFLYDFDVYQGCFNKSNSTLSASGDVAANLCSILLIRENNKVLAENFFTSLSLIGIWYTGTIRAPRLKNYPLLAEKDLKKKGMGSFDYLREEKKNSRSKLASCYVRTEPIDVVKRYDCWIRQHVHVSRPNVMCYTINI